ncbi:ATP-dependent DNA helicase RecG [Rhodoblastus acidophilus]|uniref:ATP-dependent DNA helicase RecG n=1 Tax=Rhodoblastus acidophilus TaxID=1074 RepID=A0A212QA51_RHOAC|nr:ATP-dependent DNA helicase RecG [Rhodoblastus acidophilus]PPQ40074.1 ATP-dependent DNA helicase RecG [Rhodoblastus acidophilus]RAI21123.1 ATP-dependent DNA helicase RecG [Rhodoblastus acidophilus]SNB56251.1 ATP-dependent DNA helicase RecG [Rhodoblastus acidophilus]
MRPPLLDPLFASASSLPGIGPKNAQLLDRLLGGLEHGARVLDVLMHLPHDGVDRRNRPTIAQAPVGAVSTIRIRVVEHRPPRAKGPYRVLAEDETGDLTLVFFRANGGWVEKALPVGATRWVSGLVEMFDYYKQMVHPDRILDEEGLKSLPPVEPVYGLTEGLFPRVMTKAAAGALARLPTLPEWLDAAFVRSNGWPTFAEALRRAHEPQAPADLKPDSKTFARLAYDELLSHQLALRLVRSKAQAVRGRPQPGDGVLRATLIKALPFALTGDQTKALKEIAADLASDKRMLRLLQGDVGSGKTVVALLAMAQAIEAGRQAALMAPTEILARQHFETIKPLAEAAGLTVALATGRDKATERRATLAALASGALNIVVGTHALVQEDFVFRDLGLAVIDEQHRFGVQQRLALGEKNAGVDVLAMTATPIPRSLALAYFGDMDLSALREKPPGRQPITTVTINAERIDEVVAGLGRALKGGARVYWVCPLVAESEDSDLAAAQGRAEDLQKFFGDKVGLVHGQMKGRDKDAAMEAFASGATQILVATTVIEVGVNVPEATVMVIEHAERFGLAQLHQLRGRVGRGDRKSSCILLYAGPLGETAKARLEILRETEDGFRIAEEDLKLRGEGEILGVRQSGAPGFRIARLEVHADLLRFARDDAEKLLAADPDLRGERGDSIKLLLYLFERETALKLLRAG